MIHLVQLNNILLKIFTYE